MFIAVSIIGYKIFEEDIAYKSTKYKNTLSAYNSYLDKYPNGKHIHEIEELREDSIWVVIKDVNFLYGYRYYLSLFHEGKHVLEAKNAKDSILGLNKTMRIANYKFWDESAARKIVLTEIEQFPNWSDFSNNQKIKWKHEMLHFNKVELLESDLMVCITHSNYYKNDCHSCAGRLSVFEFNYRKGWKLNKKSIAFTYGGNFGMPPDETRIVQISPDNYAILIRGNTMAQGYSNEWTSLYTYINDSVKCVLNLVTGTHNGAEELSKENCISYIGILKEGNGFYPIKQMETWTKNDGSKINNRILYKFNGKEYVNVSGIQPYGHMY